MGWIFARSVVAGTASVILLGSPVGSSDPFTPRTSTSFSDPTTRTRLDAGAAVVEVLPARDGDLAVFGVARTHIDGERLVAWMRRIEDLQKGPYVPVVVRFSDPPRIEDLDTLLLSTSDLDDIRRCRPGDCELKLSGDEIAQLRRTVAVSGANWREAVQVQFRWIMLDRAVSYLENGHDATPPYLDRHTPAPPGLEFEAVAARVRGSSLGEPRLMEYLRAYPLTAGTDIESFLYWSREELGGGKPIISITQVAIVCGADPERPEALVASKQVFATHYLSASLSLTTITQPSAEGVRYLLYTRHSRVDLFRGALGGMVRRIVEKRIRSDAPAVLAGLRRRLESGDPPSVTSSAQ